MSFLRTVLQTTKDFAQTESFCNNKSTDIPNTRDPEFQSFAIEVERNTNINPFFSNIQRPQEDRSF